MGYGDRIGNYLIFWINVDNWQIMAKEVNSAFINFSIKDNNPFD
jgi:hypothetical protein